MTSSMSLSKLYDEIVTKVKVDRSSREIEDISSAVEEMLERLVSGGIEMNHYSIQRDKITLKFQNVDIQPCGSMAEHASLWKSTRRQFRENTFLEYDYLAVLQNEDNEVEIEGGGCQGCRWIYIGDREFWSGDRKLWPGGGILLARDFNLDFLKALYSRIHSRCSCRVDPVYTSLEDDRHHDSKQFDNATPTVLYCRMHGSVCSCRVDPVYTSFEDDRHHDSKQFDNATPTVLYCRMHGSVCSCRVDPDDTSSEDDRHDSRPCTMCTVVRDTGYLQIAKIPDISPLNVKHSETCSLVFYWTSHTDSLLAPNVESLQPTEKIKRLVIRVDLLPAFKFPNNRDEDQCGIERLIITKECPNCIGPSFMVSYCKHELNAISYVSDQHRQSYIIIKFLYGQFIYWTEDRYINSFHAKVAFLTHCQTCTDEKKDCTTCVTEILESLVEAYRSKSLRLPEFHPVENLRFDRFPDDNIKAFQIPILSLLHVLSQLKCHNENDQCNSQYGPSHTKGLIKRTCRMLCGQARPGIIDVDGRLLENTVPALDILGVLLDDTGLCYSAVYDPLYMFPCPRPERGLLRWRERCIGKMIMESEVTDIRDKTLQKTVRVVQDSVKSRHKGDNFYKPLVFLTISQSVPETLNKDLENSSLTSSSDGCCNDTSDRSVPKDSILTDDLQLNWPALTPKLTKKVKRKNVRVVQDSVKRRHKGDNFYKPLVFLTISQSVPETLNKDLENSSLTSSSDGCCNDTSDRSVPKDSILTDDLQLNWPALTPKLTKKVKRRRRRCILM